jgi:hypothetical protein
MKTVCETGDHGYGRWPTLLNPIGHAGEPYNKKSHARADHQRAGDGTDCLTLRLSDGQATTPGARASITESCITVRIPRTLARQRNRQVAKWVAYGVVLECWFSHPRR